MCSTGLEKQMVSRLKRRYPTTGKLRMRLCHSMASDSPSERSYIGRTNTVKNHQCEGNFLVDSACTGAIVNSEFVFQHKLPWVKRAEPVKVTGVDGTPIEGAGVKYTTPLTMRIGHHQEEISWEIGQLERGISGYSPIEWLTMHNPEIDSERLLQIPLSTNLNARGGAKFRQTIARS
jgi:hypothetical protein